MKFQTNLDDVGCALGCAVFAEVAMEGRFFVAENDVSKFVSH